MASVIADGIVIYCVDKWENIPEDSFEIGVTTRNGWPAFPPGPHNHHIGMSAADFEANLKALGLLFTKVFPIVGDFEVVANRMSFPPVGLLHLDADHSQEATMRAFQCYQKFR